ncbi:MAG: hypothetical protein WA891_10400, partial [Acidobacteriaceae bacterium]
GGQGGGAFPEMGWARYRRVEAQRKWLEERLAKASAACCGVNLAAVLSSGFLFAAGYWRWYWRCGVNLTGVWVFGVPFCCWCWCHCYWLLLLLVVHAYCWC